ncbi:hypothetical protein GCM10023195_48550 [Actinoallomurus liliacearum]|uniref:Uncharacterized protein n=1 Tax=Actinoallomurus liliacearum TaxID=1080073 RepID=A0ABP8TM85_9ACTN
MSRRGYGAAEINASMGRSYLGLVRPPVTAYGRTSELLCPVSEGCGGGPGGGFWCGPDPGPWYPPKSRFPYRPPSTA